MKLRGIIFDLDGVIVSTDELHFQAWKKISDEEKIFFDREINERLRGISRMESLEIVLEKAKRSYTDEQKQSLAARKNQYYQALLPQLSPQNLLAGVADCLVELKKQGIRVGVGSSSKNCCSILERIGLGNYFDAVVDGTQISRSKPDPEVFLKAAAELGILPEEALVIEDAAAGVEAALAAGMKVLAVGAAEHDIRATKQAHALSEISVFELINL